MITANGRISLRQLQILIILEIFGFGAVRAPGTSSALAGPDGWLCAVIASVIITVFAYMMCKAVENSRGGGFVSYVGNLAGKPVAAVFSTIIFVRIITVCAAQLRVYCDIVTSAVLPAVPFTAVAAVTLAVAAYAASRGIEASARMAEILIVVVVISIAVIFTISAADADFSNLLPVAVSSSPTVIGRGTLASLYSFRGIEFILLAVPFVSRPEKAARRTVSCVALTGILIAMMTALSTARFGVYNATEMMWPFVEMMGAARFPGVYFGRADIVVMSFLAVSAFAFLSAGVFFSSTLLGGIFDSAETLPHKRTMLIVPAAAVIFVLAALPRNMDELTKIESLLDATLGTFVIIIIPLILLISIRIRKYAERGGES